MNTCFSATVGYRPPDVSRPLKILITTDWYAPAVNGVVTSVLNLRQELQARGHEVRVLTLSQSPHSFQEDGVSFLGSIPVGLLYPGARLRTAPAEKLVRELWAWRPDVIHSQCEFSTFLMARRMAESLEIPLIHTYHTVYENYTHYFSPSVKLGRRAVALFTRWVAARSDCLIAPTEKVATLLSTYGVTCPVRVIPTGIDLRRFQAPVSDEALCALREQLGIPQDHLVLVSIGRLAEEKNLTEVLHNLAAFRGRPVTLLLVGDGPYRETLEAQAAALDLSGQVVFTGMVPPQDVPVYYRLGDVFVSASTSETQGLTYLEALASGLPALCRRDDCLADVVIDGVNGWQYEDPDSFETHLTALAQSPELRKAMAAAALNTAEQYSAAVFAQKVEAVYYEQLSAAAVTVREVPA